MHSCISVGKIAPAMTHETTSLGRVHWLVELSTAASVLLFISSLFFTAYRAGNDSAKGISLFLCGSVGVFAGMFAWLANPAMIASWFMIRSRYAEVRVVSVFLSIAALALALSFLRQKQIMQNEAGDDATITARGAGYWLWVSSTAMAMMGCFARMLIVRQK
jgi:hypothetical protein